MKKSKLTFEINKSLPLYFDKYGMAMPQMGDSIGRTFHCAVAYPDKKYIIGMFIDECYDPTRRYPLYRHPELKQLHGNDMSRDHVLNYFMYCKYTGSSLEERKMIKSIPWRISEKYPKNFITWLQVIGPWLYIRALHYKRSWWYRMLYYTFEIPVMTVSIHLSRIIYKIGKFDDVIDGVTDNSYIQRSWHNDHSGNYIKVLWKASPRQVKLNKLMLPVYALHNFAWQLWLLPDSWAKRYLQRLCLKFTEHSNYVTRLLLGDRVTKEEVEGYLPTRSYRWTTSYDLRNSRDLSLLTEEQCEFNCMEKDLLIELYNQQGGES